MRKNLLIVSMMLLTFTSCGIDWDKEQYGEEEENNQKIIINPTIHYESIVKIDNMTSETHLTQLKENDIINISFSGKTLSPFFSPVYQKTYRSGWTEWECEVNDSHCKQCLVQEVKGCWNTRHNGQCHLKYRSFNGNIENKIIFTENLNKTKLRLKIGNNIYPLGKIISYNVDSITTEFKVTKEMIQVSNELSLIILPEKNIQNIRIGFIGLSNCYGIGRRNFSHGGSTSSSTRTNKRIRIYKIDVSFKKIK